MLELNQVSVQCEGPGEAPPPGRDQWQSELDTTKWVAYIANGEDLKGNRAHAKDRDTLVTYLVKMHSHRSGLDPKWERRVRG